MYTRFSDPAQGPSWRQDGCDRRAHAVPPSPAMVGSGVRRALPGVERTAPDHPQLDAARRRVTTSRVF